MEWNKVVVNEHPYSLGNNQPSVREMLEDSECSIRGKISAMLKSGTLYIVFGTENFKHDRLLETYDLTYETADWKGGAFFIINSQTLIPFINGQSDALKGGLTTEVHEVAQAELNKLIDQYEGAAWSPEES